MAKLKDKIKTALDEGRMLILGAQVLLGFQYRSVFEPGFEKLPLSSQYLKLCGLYLMLIAVALIMATGAYHRIVERGEQTEHFHRFASRMLLIAMVPLALGMCGDLFVVVRKITESAVAAIIGAGVMLVFFYGLWFGYTFYQRGRREGARPETEEALGKTA